MGGFYGRYSGRNAELKFYDTSFAPEVDTTGLFIAPTINDVAQGVTESTRVGRKMVIRKIHARYTWNSQPAVTAGNSDNQVRVIMGVDKQANGDAPVLLDILETNAWNAYYNLANSNRFIILHDHMLNFQATGATDDEMGGDQKFMGKQIYKTFHKNCNIPIEYDGVSGDLGTIKSNNIWIFALTRFDLPVMGVSVKVRIRFADG